MSDLVKRLRTPLIVGYMNSITGKIHDTEAACLAHSSGRALEVVLLADVSSRIDALEAALRQARSCAYPVSTEIDPRGHRWSEAYLDQLLPAINDLLKD